MTSTTHGWVIKTTNWFRFFAPMFWLWFSLYVAPCENYACGMCEEETRSEHINSILVMTFWNIISLVTLNAAEWFVLNERQWKIVWMRWTRNNNRVFFGFLKLVFVLEKSRVSRNMSVKRAQMNGKYEYERIDGIFRRKSNRKPFANWNMIYLIPTKLLIDGKPEFNAYAD